MRYTFTKNFFLLSFLKLLLLKFICLNFSKFISKTYKTFPKYKTLFTNFPKLFQSIKTYKTLFLKFYEYGIVYIFILNFIFQNTPFFVFLFLRI